MPPELIVAGVPLVVLAPAAVQGLKAMGLPTRWAGVASIGVCAVVLGLVELGKRPDIGGYATWALLSIVYGLAASGAYSQVKRLGERQDAG